MLHPQLITSVSESPSLTEGDAAEKATVEVQEAMGEAQPPSVSVQDRKLQQRHSAASQTEVSSLQSAATQGVVSEENTQPSSGSDQDTVPKADLSLERMSEILAQIRGGSGEREIVRDQPRQQKHEQTATVMGLEDKVNQLMSQKQSMARTQEETATALAKVTEEKRKEQ